MATAVMQPVTGWQPRTATPDWDALWERSSYFMPLPPPGELTRIGAWVGLAFGLLFGLLAGALSAGVETPGLLILSLVLGPLAGACCGVLLGALCGVVLDFLACSPYVPAS